MINSRFYKTCIFFTALSALTTAPAYAQDAVDPSISPLLISTFSTDQKGYSLFQAAQLQEEQNWKQIANKAGDTFSASFHHDKIAFAKENSVYIADFDGKNTKRVYKLRKHISLNDISWKPNGKELIFTLENSKNAQNPETKVISLNLSELHQKPLINESLYPGYLAVSTDGQTLAFSKLTDQGKTKKSSGIFTYSFKTKKVRKLINTPTGSPSVPVDLAWNPVQNKIAFAVVNNGSSQTRSSDLYVVDIATKKVNQITNTTNQLEMSPTWSPDGTAIAFVVRNQDDLTGKRVDIITPGSLSPSEKTPSTILTSSQDIGSIFWQG